MDIMPAFEAVVGGSNPSECTATRAGNQSYLREDSKAGARRREAGLLTLKVLRLERGRANFQQKIMPDRIPPILRIIEKYLAM